MTDHIEDKDFEKYLDGDSRVSRSYAHLKELQPPETLDRAILDQARREASKANGNWRTSRWNRWLSSLSIAAVVTLTLALVLRMELMPDAQLRPVESSASYVVTPQTDSDLMEIAPVNEFALKAAADQNKNQPIQTMAGGAAQADGGRAWDLPGERVDDDFASEPVTAARMKAEASGQKLMDSPARKPQAAGMESRELPTLNSPSATIGMVSAGSDSTLMAITEEELAEAQKRSRVKNMAMARAPATTEIADNEVAEQGLITVTGNRIQRVDIEGPSPVSVISRLDIEKNAQVTKSDTAAGLRAERQAFLQSVREDPANVQQEYENPEEWLTQIDWLIDEDRIDDARDELEVFRLAYPEFELEQRYTF